MNPLALICVLLALFALILRPSVASGSVVGVFIVLGCMGALTVCLVALAAVKIVSR